jgi:hypothetical protein
LTDETSEFRYRHRSPETTATDAPAASRIACIETADAADMPSSPHPHEQANSLALKFLVKSPI